MPGDTHSALQTEVLQKASGTDAHGALVKLRWSKDSVGYTVHIVPSTYTTAGYQGTDLLAYLGFSRSPCSFVNSPECYVRFACPDFDLAGFLAAFSAALKLLQQAEHSLNACGFALPQPEGWGYFFGKPSGAGRSINRSSDNGHVAQKTQLMKQSKDDVFRFVLSWLEDSTRKGWSIHYDPINKPLSQEMTAALDFLGLAAFKECPYLDFEPCLYRFIPFLSQPGSFHESNAERVHSSFDAHAQNFGAGLQGILEARALVAKFGLDFLKVRPTSSPTASPRKAALPAAPKTAARPFLYDVAVSFAGPERPIAEKLASAARDAGFSVFYDDFYPEQLWGKDLIVFFDQVFRKESRYCVILISQAYVDRLWTNHERRSAQARALEERGNEYILPIRIDGSDLPGMPNTVGYVSLADTGIDKIAGLLVKKLTK